LWRALSLCFGRDSARNRRIRWKQRRSVRPFGQPDWLAHIGRVRLLIAAASLRRLIDVVRFDLRRCLGLRRRRGLDPRPIDQHIAQGWMGGGCRHTAARQMQVGAHLPVGGWGGDSRRFSVRLAARDAHLRSCVRRRNRRARPVSTNRRLDGESRNDAAARAACNEPCLGALSRCSFRLA